MFASVLFFLAVCAACFSMWRHPIGWRTSSYLPPRCAYRISCSFHRGSRCVAVDFASDGAQRFLSSCCAVCPPPPHRSERLRHDFQRRWVWVRACARARSAPFHKGRCLHIETSFLRITWAGTLFAASRGFIESLLPCTHEPVPAHCGRDTYSLLLPGGKKCKRNLKAARLLGCVHVAQAPHLASVVCDRGCTRAEKYPLILPPLNDA